MKDTGCGIKPEDLPQVFEPFFHSKSDVSTGTGIGLALTKQMVEAMCGTVEVQLRCSAGKEKELHSSSSFH